MTASSRGQRIRRGATAGAIPAVALFLWAPPASAHVVHGAGPAQPWSDVVGRTVLGGMLVVSTLLLGGLLVCGAVMDRKVPAVRLANQILAAIAALADLVVLGNSGSALAKLFTPWPTGYAEAHLAVALVVLFGADRAGRRAGRWLDGTAGMVLVGVGALADHPKWSAPGALAHVAVTTLHLESAAVWAGAVALIILDRRAVRQAHRLGLIGIGSATVATVTGIFYLRQHLAHLAVLPFTAYGRVLIAKVGLVAAAVVLGIAAHRLRSTRRSGPHQRLVSAEAGAVVVVLSLAAVLTGMPASAASPPSDSSQLTRVAIAGATVSVVVTPDRPGPNLIQVGDGRSEPPAGRFGSGPPLRFESDDGAGEWSAIAALGAGTHTLDLVVRGRSTKVPIRVPAGTSNETPLGESVELSGVDRAECLSQNVGRLVAVSEANQSGQGPFVLTSDLSWARDLIGVCGAAGSAAAARAERSGLPIFGAPQGTEAGKGLAIEVDPSTLGAAYGQELLRSGVHRVALVSDASPRSVEFAGGVREALSRPGVSVQVFSPETLPGAGLPNYDLAVVATSWPNFGVVRARITAAGRNPVRGLFAAPWILDQGLVGESLTGAAQIVVGLPESPQSPITQQYLSALTRYAPGERPSFAGLIGYFEARTAMDQIADGKPLSSPDEQADLRNALAALRGRAAGLTAGTGSPSLQFFTPVRISFLPATLDAGHGGHSPPSFIDDGGTLAAVSAVYPVPD